MPKHSLFGSALEIQDETGARQLENLDPKTVRVPKTPTPRGPGQRFVLSDDVKENLPGRLLHPTVERERERERDITEPDISLSLESERDYLPYP